MRLCLLAFPLALSGCITLSDFESEPVAVQTEAGTVTCQLYGINQVIYDKAIAHPETITTEQANAICRAEGERRKPVAS